VGELRAIHIGTVHTLAIVEWVEGLLYKPDVITPEEEQALLAAMEGVDFRQFEMRGQVARRTVRHYGLDYDYEGWKLVPADPLPEPLEWVRDRCAQFAQVEPAALAQTLVTRYPPEAGIGWHRDAPMFGEPVIGVSLGAPARMRFQRGKGTKREVSEVTLEPRSGYALSGPARWSWQHSIPATKDLRYSITFRTLRRKEAEA
jgi:alkylated DNA repair dioxygenase AlkB